MSREAALLDFDLDFDFPLAFYGWGIDRGKKRLGFASRGLQFFFFFRCVVPLANCSDTEERWLEEGSEANY